MSTLNTCKTTDAAIDIMNTCKTTDSAIDINPDYAGGGMEVWENEKCCGNTNHRQAVPQLFCVLPNFHECFYNLIET